MTIDSPPPIFRRPSVRLPSVLIIVGLAITMGAFWPGLMTWDAVRQYDQALSGKFDDWHPPAMEWLWRRLIAIHRGPAPMLLVQLALFWGGMALLARWALRQARPWLATGIVGCALMPWPLAVMGMVLKDCLMAGAILLSVGLLAIVGERPGGHPVLRSIAIALLVAASTLRFNAFLATVPLGLVLLPVSWRASRARFAVAAIGTTLLMTTALPVANRLLGAEKSGVELSLVIFDLGGITEHSGVNVFPALEEVPNPVAANHRCYRPDKWDSYSWWVDPICPIEFYGIQDWFAEHHANPALFLARAIAAHPVAYAQHRLTHYNIATRFLASDTVDRPSQRENAPNPWHYRVVANTLLNGLDGLSLALAHTPLEWPCVWIALALGALVVGPSLPSARLVVPLAASSALYGLGYAVVSVASELRYYLWTVVAAAIANIIIIADLRSGVLVQRRRLLIAYAPAVAITLAAIGWRMAAGWA